MNTNKGEQMDTVPYQGDACSNVYAKDPDLKSYVGCKVILAKPMHENEWAQSKNQESAGREGYLVVYAGGYRSWSPKEEFDLAYRELSHAEKSIITF
jgi:hypothetical protein